MSAFNHEHLQHFRFKQLFNDLGWDSPAQQQPYVVALGDESWQLDVVALKKGVQVLHCLPDATGRLPSYSIRQKIERKVTPDVHDHLIVFTDVAKTTQIWQWVSREKGKTAQYREVAFRTGDTPELLTQKLSRLRFTLEEEELLTVLGVTDRLDDSKPREKVTKTFYGEFAKQREAFAAFIAGIAPDSEDQRWYTAVVLNRLMFLWFLQEKGFLDGKHDYLQMRLAAHDAAAQSESFYRHFLTPLFFRGFALQRTPENRDAFQTEFGNVPYLNGGLFAQHELEQRYGNTLDIPDAAFHKLFAFFDQWEWHLDDRPLKSGKEINPDVLGYIFEKFVNQKQMGAYYTKEDITDYIGKNTIIPSFLGKVRAQHPSAFDQLAWSLLAQSGDAYIYPAMLKGVDAAYPARIAAGLDAEAPDLPVPRRPWNQRADEAVSLPTEIWRETIARHQRTREVRAIIAAGGLREVGDLITYNLNIRQFAQDLIERCTDVALLKSFWFNLAGRLPRKSNEKFRHGLSVLDPTCGSGAFLFAALNILKPLYDATLRTMQAVRTDALIAGDTSHPEKWAEVDELLARFAAAGSEHAQDYAVIKHIIVHNLYGVDIEKQATEIAKLRLFLKLVALLEPGDDIEPLPDIDFNIRHGNTLVGYATKVETERAVRGTEDGQIAAQGKLLNEQAWVDIEAALTAVHASYDNFQIQQNRRGGHVSPADKQDLAGKLQDLAESLNRHLADEYGVDWTKNVRYEKWKASYRPLHWYVDFHPLMASGGFDVVIGNPPYISASKVRASYNVRDYETASASDIYAWCLERTAWLVSASGSTGMIVPLSLAFSRDFDQLRGLLYSSYRSNWFSSFARIPAALFAADVRVRNVIHIGRKSGQAAQLTTRLHRWFEEYRPYLMESLSYAKFNPSPWQRRVPKLGSSALIQAFEQALGRNRTLAHALQRGAGEFPLYFKKSAYNWLSFGREEAPCFDGAGRSITQSKYGRIDFGSAKQEAAALLLLNGKLEFAFWVAIGDDFDVTRWMFDEFPVDLAQLAARMGAEGRDAADRLWNAMQDHVSFKLNAGKRVGNFNLSEMRGMTDATDMQICRHLGWMHLWPDIDLLYSHTVKTTADSDADGDD